MHMSLPVERFVPTKVIHVRNKDKPLFNDDCRLAFDIKQGAHLRWTLDRSRVNWDEFVHYQRRANAVYAEAMRQFSVRSRDVLMNAQCPHPIKKIWRSLSVDEPCALSGVRQYYRRISWTVHGRSSG